MLARLWSVVARPVRFALALAAVAPVGVWAGDNITVEVSPGLVPVTGAGFDVLGPGPHDLTVTLQAPAAIS